MTNVETCVRPSACAPLRLWAAQPRLPLLLAAFGLLALPGLAAQTQPASGEYAMPEHAIPESAPTVFVGRVLAPDGAPAAGAVVVTTAGGRAVTDAEGSFSLEVGLPLEAESVRVTAVLGSGTGSLVGSALVAGLAHWGTTAAGTVVLEQASSCQPSWLPTFGQLPGATGSVKALTVFDDGSGPALYAGGTFTYAGSVAANWIAKWNGSSWSALGSGVALLDGWCCGEVLALTVFDDGSGPALYAGGSFWTAGGATADNIAKWDGTSWSALGSGMNGPVRALTVFDDGSGPALYAGGSFTSAGGVAANTIAKWDGSSWSALGSGMNHEVHALTVFDDASGPALYAGGWFTTAGGVAANRIAKWDGSSWSALGSGMIFSGSNTGVYALTAFDDGSGPALCAGGHFTSAGGVAANSMAKWDGSSWSALGSGMIYGDMFTGVYALTAFDDGSGPALYAGGNFSTGGSMAAYQIAKWDGTSWSPLGSGMSSAVHALTVFDDGSGPALYAGGDFFEAGGVAASFIAKWDGSSWSALGSGMNGFVTALTVFDDGSGPALYAGGWFTTAGDVAANRIAKWDGSSWSALGSGMNNVVYALTVFDDGSGPALYAGGDFSAAGGVLAISIAKWNGSRWSALGSGVALLDGWCCGAVRALTVFDDGSGPALYAGGELTTAKWDGTSWSALGSPIGVVTDLTAFDDGSGPVLYAGGVAYSTGGDPGDSYYYYPGGVAKWDGSNWSPLGSGMTSDVNDLMVFDDGSGPALYAGGLFGTAGGVAANHIAKWNGSSWSALGSGMNNAVWALTVFDDGVGPALYAGGLFTAAGGVATNRIAKWNGSSWSALGSGVDGAWYNNPAVSALTGFDDGSGAALYAGGSFLSAIDSGDSYLAKWGGCPVMPSAWTNLGFALPGATGVPLLVGTGDLSAGSAGTLTLCNAAPSSLAMLFASLGSTPAPFKCGTLVPLPVGRQLLLVTDGRGGAALEWASWPGDLSGLDLYFQYAIPDAGAICGVALSNALRADVP